MDKETLLQKLNRLAFPLIFAFLLATGVPIWGLYAFGSLKGSFMGGNEDVLGSGVFMVTGFFFLGVALLCLHTFISLVKEWVREKRISSPSYSNRAELSVERTLGQKLVHLIIILFNIFILATVSFVWGVMALALLGAFPPV